LFGVVGSLLSVAIRLELFSPFEGAFFETNCSPRYMTTVTNHGVIMVFLFVMPVLIGGFGN